MGIRRSFTNQRRVKIEVIWCTYCRGLNGVKEHIYRKQLENLCRAIADLLGKVMWSNISNGTAMEKQFYAL